VEKNTFSNSPLKSINNFKILIPILIGFVVIAFLFYDEFDITSFSQVSFTYWTFFWLFMAFLMMIMRDLGYIIRLKILSNKELSWVKCIRIIFLWEFTSAITPSAIGGTSVALYYIHKEGITVGKSTAVVLATSFLDELYFILMFPLLILTIQSDKIFSIGNQSFEGFDFSNQFFYFAVLGYSFKLIFLLFVFYGLFINPYGLKKILTSIFKIKYLKKWQHKMDNIGEDIVMASKELKQQKITFWIKSFLATFISWTSRYWVVNCIFLAFFIVDDHFLIFARQLVMWIMMLIMPTPGGSGFAEYVFSEFLGEFIPIVGFSAVIIILWRLITYYTYLIIGIIVLPSWLKKKYSKK
jgi:glycosyltransferase 2 family protein